MSTIATSNAAIANLLNSLINLSFTCQPKGRPLQTITVTAISGLTADVTIQLSTKKGLSAQRTQMHVATLISRLSDLVDTQPSAEEQAARQRSAQRLAASEPIVATEASAPAPTKRGRKPKAAPLTPSPAVRTKRTRKGTKLAA